MKKASFIFQDFAKEYINEVSNALNNINFEELDSALSLIVETYQRGSKVFIFGNGGSASTATHMACDLGKGTLARYYDNKEKRLRVISLTDNIALLTAYANDLSFDNAFVQQLRNLVDKNDLVIVISGSGNSKNLIKAVKYAKESGAKTLGILGFTTGGKLRDLVDKSIIVQSNHYGPIEDIHLVMNHLLTSGFARLKQINDNHKQINNKAVPYTNTPVVKDNLQTVLKRRKRKLQPAT